MAYQPASDVPLQGQQVRFDTVNTSHDRAYAGYNFDNTNGNDMPGSSRSTSIDNDPALVSPGASGTNAAPQASTSGSGNTRIRIAKACTPCRRVKLKCNGETPCGRCSTLHLPIDQCTYPPSLRGKTRRKKVEIEAERRARGTSDSPPRSRGRVSVDPSQSQRGSGAGGYLDGDTRQGRETHQWDQGWTMRRMKEDFAKWKHDEALTMNGPRNSNIWYDEKQAHDGLSGQMGLSTRIHDPSFTSPSGSAHKGDLVPDRYTTLPFPGDAHNPLGVLAEASASAGKTRDDNHAHPSPFQPTGGPGARIGSEGDDEDLGSRGYYVPLERVLKNDAPHIMSLITISEAEQLFETYFKLLHPHLPFLDREHSTPAALAQRNNFLFNAICCVAARATHAELWSRLKEFATFEMDRFPKDKNIDVVQGHLIFSVWNVTGPKTFEQDKSWLRVGIAVRAAIDINLHRVALSKSARQGLPNWLLRMIIRTWLLTYVIDRTLSAQLGKPATMRGEPSFQLYSDLLSHGEGRKTIDDAWVSSLAEWTRVLGKVHDVFGSDSSDFPTARSVSSQFPDLVHVFQKQFHQLCDSSLASARAFEHIDGGRASKFTIANVHLYSRYARLIIHSFALQRASESRKADLPSAFAEYQISAIRLIEEFQSDFEAVGLARGCPDFVFTFLTFGAVSLLKGAQPQYAHLEPDRHSLISLARKAASILARSAATPDHLPAIQHSFLSRLIDSRSKPSTLPVNGFPIMDFEAFGQSIDADLSKTPWPPTGPSAITHTATRPPSPARQNPAEGVDQSVIGQGIEQPIPAPNANLSQAGLDWGLSMDVHAENDGFGWLSGIGAGGGFFGNGNEADLAFAQDPFWKSILEGTPAE